MNADPADATDVIRLWPDGPPTTLEGVGPEIAYAAPPGPAVGTTFFRNISDPTLAVYAPAPEAANGVGVIVAPGGGWTINAYSHEGVDVARWLVDAGYTAFLLKYRVMATTPDQAAFEAGAAAQANALGGTIPAADAPRAIGDLIKGRKYEAARAAAAEDGRRAIATARARAEDYGVRADAIGMIGFSAGAFLTVDVAMDPQAEPLAFIAAIYGGETLGAPVADDAPPLFSVVTQEDRLMFKVVEGLYADWTNADRPAELHLFRRGPHGFGMARLGLPVDRWTDLFADWLRDLGY